MSGALQAFHCSDSPGGCLMDQTWLSQVTLAQSSWECYIQGKRYCDTQGSKGCCSQEPEGWGACLLSPHGFTHVPGLKAAIHLFPATSFPAQPIGVCY
jgi:hypothetical protein